MTFIEKQQEGRWRDSNQGDARDFVGSRGLRNGDTGSSACHRDGRSEYAISNSQPCREEAL